MENKKNITLTLQEVYELEAELGGFSVENKIVFEGLLNLKLPIVLKYHLNKLHMTLKEEKKLMDEARQELIKKYGTEKENGSVVIEPVLTLKEEDEDGQQVEKRVTNENFVKFQEEYDQLLMEKKEIECNQFNIDDFSKIETNDNYTVFYKLFD